MWNFQSYLLNSLLSNMTREARVNHPYLNTFTYIPPALPTQPLQLMNHDYFPQHAHHSALVPANPLLNVEVPKWLRVYMSSSTEKDHIIKWNMFQVHQLECYDNMINKLVKEELQKIYVKYELQRWVVKLFIISNFSLSNFYHFRNAIHMEIERRKQEQRYNQPHVMYLDKLNTDSSV